MLHEQTGSGPLGVIHIFEPSDPSNGDLRLGLKLGLG
jgi:hypothetical protein